MIMYTVCVFYCMYKNPTMFYFASECIFLMDYK